MIKEVRERVLTYKDEQIRAWTQGDKSLAPSFLDVAPAVFNQPQYHFGEVFTLRSYHERDGWLGFILYALGGQYPRSASRLEGRRKAEQIIPADALRRFRDARMSDSRGGGEPDLFLYKPDGSFMFVEVKKAGDRISPSQLRCIAQIVGILGCPVDIVYLRRENQNYDPKTYQLDLSPWLAT
jgi:VRR-NUC domain